MQVDSIVEVYKSLEDGIFIYRVNAWTGTFKMHATAGGSDECTEPH